MAVRTAHSRMPRVEVHARAGWIARSFCRIDASTGPMRAGTGVVQRDPEQHNLAMVARGAQPDTAAMRCSGQLCGGMSTLSIKYTVALAVCTPPHTTAAPSTFKSSPLPVTVTSAPSTVLCVPAISSGLNCPGTTW